MPRGSPIKGTLNISVTTTAAGEKIGLARAEMDAALEVIVTQIESGWRGGYLAMTVGGSQEPAMQVYWDYEGPGNGVTRVGDVVPDLLH